MMERQSVSSSFARPTRDLAEIVAGFRHRRSTVPASPFFIALPARTDVFAEFYIGTPYLTRTADGLTTAPAAVVVGPSTAHHTDIGLGGPIDTFTIKFQPTALHRLFGLPGQAIVDRAEDAAAIEQGLDALYGRIADARTFEARVDIAEGWLRARLASARPANALDRTARLIRRSAGRIDVDRLAHDCDMGARNFRRCFTAAIGISPKRYCRIARFNAALDLKASQPTQNWTDIAQQLGYFDQSHMLRDARAFAHGMTLPGRALSDAEMI